MIIANRWLISVGAVAATWVLGALAQEYPTKPIHIMVPYETGGTSDLTIRAIQPRLAAILGQPVLIENRPGAGGLTGTEIVAKAAPDGYTVLNTFDSFIAVPFLYSNVQHDPVKDFSPVSLMVKAPQVLVVHPGLGPRNLEEFLQLARRRGPDLTISTAGPGSSSRLTVEMFRGIARIDPTLVSYKGGGPALSAVLGGHVAGFMASIGTAFSNVKSGKLVALAVSSTLRTPLLPEVPTFAETFPGYEAQSWVGLVVPAGTPNSIVLRLNAAVFRALTEPESKQRFESQGMEVVASTPQEYADWIRDQVQKWGPIIRSLKIRLD
mgnify:CR=1 FL=1